MRHTENTHLDFFVFCLVSDPFRKHNRHFQTFLHNSDDGKYTHVKKKKNKNFPFPLSFNKVYLTIDFYLTIEECLEAQEHELHVYVGLHLRLEATGTTLKLQELSVRFSPKESGRWKYSQTTCRKRTAVSEPRLFSAYAVTWKIPALLYTCRTPSSTGLKLA